MQFHTKQRVVHDLLLNYYTNDRRARRAVVFLHGWRAEAALWLPVLKELKSEDAIYCPDLPGFGGSELPEEPYGVGEYADVIADFVADLKLRNVILVGHSFGGRVAIALAARRPKFLKGIVLVDSAGFVDETRMKQMKRLVARVLRPIFRRDALRELRKTIYRVMGSEDYVATPELRETYLKTISEDLSAAMEKIEVPAGIIWGELDRDAPLAWAHRMRGLIKDAELTVLKKAGHFSFMDDRAGFIAALKKYLSRM